MKFSSPDKVWSVVDIMRRADFTRSYNRSLVNDLFNGLPPFSDDEAKKNNVVTNVNFLEGTKLAMDARRQYMNGFMKPGNFFSVQVDYGPAHKKDEWGRKITHCLNRLMKKSLAYYEVQRSTFAQVVLHGIGPKLWQDNERWCPYSVGIEDVKVPSGTLLSLENLDSVDRISDEPMLSPIPEHQQLLVEDSDLDSPQIAWVDVETNMREVSRWQQPLLRGPHVCCHDLYVRINGILEFGFPEVTEPGIPHSMLGSSNEQVTGCAANGRILCEMWQSEEGSRFWKDVNQYRIVMVDCDTAQDLIWMSAGAMNRLTLKDMVFTGEARTLISLMLGALYQ